MANNTNKVLKEGYDRLKKILEKMTSPKKEQPRLVLQPIRNQPPIRRAPWQQEKIDKGH